MRMKKLGFCLSSLSMPDCALRMAKLFMENGFTYFETDATSESCSIFRQAVSEHYPRRSYTIAGRMPLVEKKELPHFWLKRCSRWGFDHLDYCWIPYTTEPETTVLPDGIERGTLAHTYEMIDSDIEEALPLIDDNIYSVPKYHFNQKAAYAFAARFNLYYHKFDKVIEYADKTLGQDPSATVRNWKAFSELATDFELRCNSYVSGNEACNLMLLTANSSWPYVQGPYAIGLRYGSAYDIMLNEILPGPWGGYNKLNMANGIWGFEQKYSLPKLLGYFEYTDKTAGIGYLHLVNVAFSTDELLLCRAEAKLLKTPQDIDGAVADINILLNSMAGINLTKDQIVNYFSSKPYMPLHLKKNSQRSIKKELHPQGFSIPDNTTENLIQCVLHLRRVTTVHEGLRWNDIKRYGIEYSHARSGKADDELLVNDPRRAVQIPQEVIAAGLEANPRNN